MVTTMETDTIREKMNLAWEMGWKHFFRPETNLFYDWLSSYETGHELDHLPTSEEVRRQYPNPCGWGTGMEDSMITAGAVLSMICDRHAVTQEEFLRDKAAAVFNGMVSCAEIHGTPGFIARSICLEDRKSVYINSSRDQYTHYVHGFWKFYFSPLCDEAQKRKIRTILVDIARYMERCVTPENDYTFFRQDGIPCPATVCKMWNVDAHEAARLPMIYAAAWKISGDSHWRAQYLRYAREAAEQSTRLRCHPYVAYALLQMQCSLELLIEADDENPEIVRNYRAAMNRAAELVSYNELKSMQDFETCDLTMLCSDWRNRPFNKIAGVYDSAIWGDYLTVLMCQREGGEAALVQMMTPGYRLSKLQLEILKKMILMPDYRKFSSYGIHYLQAAYWKACRLQYKFIAKEKRSA